MSRATRRTLEPLRAGTPVAIFGRTRNRGAYSGRNDHLFRFADHPDHAFWASLGRERVRIETQFQQSVATLDVHHGRNFINSMTRFTLNLPPVKLPPWSWIWLE